tara:strand:+ start:487 stop:669 length:183 start_codon:yes stop_codon:yes gene_type:complete
MPYATSEQAADFKLDKGNVNKFTAINYSWRPDGKKLETTNWLCRDLHYGANGYIETYYDA